MQTAKDSQMTIQLVLNALIPEATVDSFSSSHHPTGTAMRKTLKVLNDKPNSLAFSTQIRNFKMNKFTMKNQSIRVLYNI